MLKPFPRHLHGTYVQFSRAVSLGLAPGTSSTQQRASTDRWRRTSPTILSRKSSCLKQPRTRTRSSASHASPRRRTICNPAFLLARYACAIHPINGTRSSNAMNLCTRAIARRTASRLAPGTRTPSSASASKFAPAEDCQILRKCHPSTRTVLPFAWTGRASAQGFLNAAIGILTSATRQASTTQPHSGTKTWSTTWAQQSASTRR